MGETDGGTHDDDAPAGSGAPGDGGGSGGGTGGGDASGGSGDTPVEVTAAAAAPVTVAVAPTPPRDAGVERVIDLDKKLNQVSTTLMGATAGVGAVLTILGASSDRIWVLLDDSTVKKLVFGTAALALVAIALALRALLETDARRTARLLFAGSLAFVGSLGMAVWTVGSGANLFALPTFTDVSVEAGGDGGGAVLHLSVRAESVDETQRIGVRVVDADGDTAFDSTVPPDAEGVAEQSATVTLQQDHGTVLLQAWHRDRSPKGSQDPDCERERPVAGTACLRIDY
ncbi:MAG TPA: hypothetical protein VF743_12450 [Acidimicrobiales bacterium]